MSGPMQKFDLEEWINAAREVHWSATHSNESPSALRSIGGVFALAGEDVRNGLRVEKDKHLWFIDGEADRKTIDSRTRKSWKVWENLIRKEVRNAASPKDGVANFFRKFKMAPQTTLSLKSMMQPTVGNIGSYPTTWQYDVANIRYRVNRGLNIMTGPPIGAITTGAVAFAKGGFNPTQEDWEEAYAWGELVRIAEEGLAVGKITKGATTRGVQTSTPHRPAIIQKIGSRGVSNNGVNRPSVQQKRINAPTAKKVKPESGSAKSEKTSKPKKQPNTLKKVDPNKEKSKSKPKQDKPKRTTQKGSKRRDKTRRRRTKKNELPKITLKPSRKFNENEIELLSSYPKYVRDFFNKYHKLNVDLGAANEVYQLFRSTRPITKDGGFTRSRAASMELSEIARLDASHNVQKIYVLKVRREKGARTADLGVKFTNGKKLNVEVTTLTGSRRGQRHGSNTLQDGTKVRSKPPKNHIKQQDHSAIKRAFIRKIKRGQVSEQEPGVITVRVLHAPKNGVFLTKSDVQSILKAADKNKGVRELILIHPSLRGRKAWRIGDKSSGQQLSQGKYVPPK